MNSINQRAHGHDLIGDFCVDSNALNTPAEIRDGVLVNDIHSRLNATRQKGIVSITAEDDLTRILSDRSRGNETFTLAGGRHAMGGQQFGEGGILVDTRSFNKIVGLDTRLGYVTVQSGIHWSELVQGLRLLQDGAETPWTIIQKPTGADDISIGGSLSANCHGRVLNRKPFVDDVASFHLVTADGTLLNLSRRENSELFGLVAGGYGLFGAIGNVTLKLMRRQKLRRTVETTERKTLAGRFQKHILSGATYGDFQFAIDSRSDEFLNTGILSVYKETSWDETTGARKLSETEWMELLQLAHHDKTAAFERYSKHYLATSGQVYLSDDFQLSTYVRGYHKQSHGSEMITELYVPLEKLDRFLESAADIFRSRNADVIYGTVRLIKRDDQTFMPWARDDFACVIFNLHVEHQKSEIEHAAGTFRSLIDLSIQERGSYYLTYHRYATKAQVESCYQQFAQFLDKKEEYDPRLRFQSNWYRHYRAMFAN